MKENKKKTKGFYSKFIKSIREKDMFAHNISLNFNNDGSSHGTCIGGFFSTLIRLTILLYIIYMLKRSILYEYDWSMTSIMY
jgi:hypothetical protein